MVDPGKGPGGPGPPLFLDQTEVQRAEKKIFFETESPPARPSPRPPPPPYLEVWIRYCLLLLYLCLLVTYVVEQVSNEYFFLFNVFFADGKRRRTGIYILLQ